jgi:transketolase
MFLKKSDKVVTEDFVRQAKLRLLKMHYASGVGHIGGNLSALDAMLMIFHECLTDDDRFILSKGHSAGALYICLWTLGLISEAELESFHKENTLLAGHPPAGGLPLLDFATGSLGHGLSLAAGTALAMRFKGTLGNVFCLTSDGEWQEGSTWEAVIFASHQRLSNLVVMVDQNGLQGFGTTQGVASMSSLAKKIEGFGIDLQNVNGHSLPELRKALSRARTGPLVVVMETIKGKGVSFMENQMEWHYRPLTASLYDQATADVESE